MSYNETFAIRLKKLRTAKGISQFQLGEMLGLKLTTISSYEIGKSQPTMENLIKLAEYFGVSLDFLMCRDSDTKTITDKEIPEELKALGIDAIKINQLSSSELQQELTDLVGYAEKIKNILKKLGK